MQIKNRRTSSIDDMRHKAPPPSHQEQPWISTHRKKGKKKTPFAVRPSSGQRVYNNHHTTCRYKIRVGTTKAFFHDIVPHITTKIQPGDSAKVRVRTASIIDLLVLGRTSSSIWANDDGTVRSEEEILPAMAIVRQSLVFTKDMEKDYISRTMIATSEFKDTVGDDIDLNKLYGEFGGNSTGKPKRGQEDELGTESGSGSSSDSDEDDSGYITTIIQIFAASVGLGPQRHFTMRLFRTSRPGIIAATLARFEQGWPVSWIF